MDDTDQKMIEVQKTYANVILNETREAAARVMLAQRKAAKFEFELKESKENSIQMLVRIKQMMDSKMSEAAIISRSQQKKIEELEAQLAEAENIVKDLREELSAVKGELKMASPNDSIAFLSQVEQPIRSPNSQKDESNKCSKLNRSNSLFPIVRPCTDDHDLTAIISREKRTKRYISGCTQQIHACERDNNSKGYLKLKADKEGEKLLRCPSVRNEKKKSEKKVNSVKEKGTSIPIIPFDHEAVKSSLTNITPVACLINGNSNTDTGLVSVENVFRRIRGEPSLTCKDFVSVSFVQRAKEQLLPLEHKKTALPQSSETQVDRPKLRTLLTEGILSRPKSSGVIKYTFQRKRKRGTLVTNGSNLSYKLKKNESNESVLLESEKVNSKGESIEEETDKVISGEESTEEENLELMVARELLSLKSRWK